MNAAPDDPAWKVISEALRMQRLAPAALYVLATPIGNLADLGFRALDVLRRVDAIAAEDTRHSHALLDRLGIAAPLIACHEHNERAAAERVIERLASGARVAYVSDAGTPGISDPGARLVDAVRTAGYTVVAIPGPSAIAAALSVGGFTLPAFHFAGFLPTRSEARARGIAALAGLNATLVFYEAPHRIVESVQALCDGLGAQRRLVIARELTKLHEQVHACALGAAVAWLEADANRQRGEFVLMVEGAAGDAPDDADLDRVLAPLVRALPLKQAVALAVEITERARNAVYARALELKKASGESAG